MFRNRFVANSHEDGTSTMTQEYPVDREKVEARKPIHPGVIFAEDVMPEITGEVFGDAVAE